MQEAIQRRGASARPLLTVSALLTLLGAAGLIVPGVVQQFRWVTPVAATFTAGLLLMSMLFHIKCREKPKLFVNIAFFAFAVFVAHGRWLLVR